MPDEIPQSAMERMARRNPAVFDSFVRGHLKIRAREALQKMLDTAQSMGGGFKEKLAAQMGDPDAFIAGAMGNSLTALMANTVELLCEIVETNCKNPGALRDAIEKGDCMKVISGGMVMQSQPFYQDVICYSAMERDKPKTMSARLEKYWAERPPKHLGEIPVLLCVKTMENAQGISK
jgi:hypothetical protein